MNNTLKTILAIVVAIFVAVGGWFLYEIYGPKLAMEDALPSSPLFYAQLKDPQKYWDAFEQTDLFKNLSTINLPEVLKRNKVPPERIRQVVVGLAKAKVLMKNPVVAKLLGKEIAIAQYYTTQPNANLVLITRSKASIQVAANLSLFLKEWGDIAVKQEKVDGQVIVHVAFKQNDLSFKYAHISDLLVFMEEDSTLMTDIIQTVNHRHPSLRMDSKFNDVAGHFYPGFQGSFYLNIPQALASQAKDWVRSGTINAGFEGYGISFLPGTMTKYKFILVVDPAKADPLVKDFMNCSPSNNGSAALIPPSAIAYHWGGCYEFSKLESLLKKVAQTALQDQSKGLQKSISKKMSSKEMEDIFGILGTEAGGYMTDVDTRGMLPYPRLLFFVKVKDEPKAQQMLDELLASNASFRLMAQEEYKGSKIHFIALPMGGNVDPGFVLHDGYFLFASSKQLIKKSLDTYQEPARSIIEDKTYKSMGLNQEPKASSIFFLKIKDMSTRMIGILEWYEHYLSNQVELAGTYKKEALLKKKELAEDIVSQKEEIRLASIKLKEWQDKPKAGASPEDAASIAQTIKNFQQQVKMLQLAISDDQQQAKDIDRVTAKNALQVQKYKGIIYNNSHVLVPLLKGLQSFNVQSLKVSAHEHLVEAELMLN